MRIFLLLYADSEILFEQFVNKSPNPSIRSAVKENQRYHVGKSKHFTGKRYGAHRMTTVDL